MSADPCIESEGTPTTGLAEALYFESGEHRLFGWLHRGAADRPANIGLVLCKPFGYESVCAHRSLRAFAEAAAALGIPTLRFDYAGTGDSSELDPDADQLEVWIADVVAAVAELRRVTGVERVCLLGFRIGALLATLAAERCRAVHGLVLIAPIVNGNRYLRELRTARLAAALGTEESPASRAAGADDGIEVGGFRFSGATLEALARIDLRSRSVAPCSEMLVIDGIRMPGARVWVEELVKLGSHASHVTLPGLIEMILTAPQFAAIPRAMINAMCDWLAPLRNVPFGVAAGESPPEDLAPVPLTQVMSLPPSGPGQHGLTERPLFLPSQALLFGILSDPGQEEMRRRAVILVNAGADYHIGASGMYVALARRWARRGYMVLRMDLAGLGDSGTRPGLSDNNIFPPAALEDIRTAIDWLRSRHGITDVTLGGVCSGAYHTLRAAVCGLPVNRILMINPETFFWDESMSIHDMQLAELVRDPRLYWDKLISATAWKKLLRGRVDVRYVLKLCLRRALFGIESRFRNSARRLHIPLPRDLGAELEEVGRRGIRLVFVFARGEPGIELLKLQGGMALKRLGDRCRMHIIDGADHVFSKLETRSALANILSDELFAPVGWTSQEEGRD
jgi:alpha-beta hydrolase superfamily lysophospholipase